MPWLRAAIKFLAIPTATFYMFTLASLAHAEILNVDPAALKWAGLKNESDASKRILTDAALKALATKPFDAELLMKKSYLLGKYNNSNVIATFPCSDICPNYTVRIIYLDVKPESCKATGGKVTGVVVPMGISLATENYCIPKKILPYQDFIAASAN